MKLALKERHFSAWLVHNEETQIFKILNVVYENNPQSGAFL